MDYSGLEPYKNLIKTVFDFFTSKVTNPDYHEKIKAYCKEESSLKNTLDHSDFFLKFGYLSTTSFVLYNNLNKLTDGFSMATLELVLEVLTKNFILTKSPPYSINNKTTLYLVNDDIAKYFASNGLLFNKLFGFSYIIKQYTPSVFKIENHQNGTPEIGNGFLISSGKHSLIITNQHVVDKAEKLVIKNHKEEVIKHSKILEYDKNDLAIIILQEATRSLDSFLLNPHIKILEEILTIGYPPIPTTKASYLLCHLGEINSLVENYWGHELFIFSAKTNPGNSGSPIIDSQGSVVGIITQQLEEKEWYKKSKIPYYAGIPSRDILKFIQEVEHEII